MPQATIQYLIRIDDIITPHTNALKPNLTETNKLTRFFYAVSHVHEIREDDNDKLYDFSAFDFNQVHLDEKWFFLTEENLRVYLARGEEAPNRSVKHKSHIIKVMFLCAVARPRYDNNGNCTFDGKIGIWPFIKKVRAQRSSKNRKKGAIESKPVSVTANVYKQMVFEKVLPAIKAKWPRGYDGYNPVGELPTINLQHDNAPVHFDVKDDDWQKQKRLYSRCINLKLKEQLANSPDCNILDLGFFRSLQSLQWGREPAMTVEGLIKNVEGAFNDYAPDKLNRTWITHQTVMEEIILCHGDNDYNIPHLGKEKLSRKKDLPKSMELNDSTIGVLKDCGLI